MKEKKYFEIYKIIKSDVISGKIKAGEKLPSKRICADKNGCSVITVEKAYNMLAEEGYIESKERSGYFVLKLDVFPVDEKNVETNIKYLDDIREEPTHELEYSLWFKTVRKVMSEQGNRLFVKSPGKGCSILRNAIAEYLFRYRGMVAQPENIIIGSGSEQLYETVIKVLGRDRIYGIENPCYKQIEVVYSSEGAKIKKLKMGKDGIESEALKSGGFDVLHVTPFRSYPTGITTSVLKKYEYLNWADKKRYIVEDDFNSEFFPPGQPIESLYSLDRESVIYINTFSKSLSPSMRMGYMILPDKLMKLYDKKLGGFSCSVPVLDQYILAEFIKSGNFERHLNRMRRKMKK